MKAFNAILPAAWSHANPVDILGDAEPERYAKSLEIAAKDASIDGMLVIMTPQDMTNPTKIAEELKPYAKGLGKPVLASWMGGAIGRRRREILNQAGIPSFHYPDTRRARLQLHVALHLQPEGTVRDSVAERIGRMQPDRERANGRFSPMCVTAGAPSSPSTNRRSCWSPTAFPACRRRSPSARTRP